MSEQMPKEIVDLIESAQDTASKIIAQQAKDHPRTIAALYGDGKTTGCICKEIREGGNICHSNDVCECQLFGTFDDPTYCGEDELKEIKKGIK